MKVKAWFLIVTIALLGLAGCAGLEMKNIKTSTDDADALGIRYYESAPFLLVYTDGKGALATELMYLPDTTQLRSIRPYAYGATNDATFTFSGGVMKTAKSVVDETAVPIAVLGGLEKIATSLAKAGNAPLQADTGIPPPYLFRIRKDKVTGLWTLDGGQAVKPPADRPASPIQVVKPADGQPASPIRY